MVGFCSLRGSKARLVSINNKILKYRQLLSHLESEREEILAARARKIKVSCPSYVSDSLGE